MARVRLLALAVALAPASAGAAAALLEGDAGELTLGGYARTLEALQEPRLEFAPGVPQEAVPTHRGLSETVLRLEWRAALGSSFTAEVHQRVFMRIASETSVLGNQVGLGSSVAPGRTVRLRSVAYDEDRLVLEHDVDRLAVRASLGDFDVRVGRQAITWGVAELFPVADLWTSFSPFELDTTEKRGIDALRVIYSRGRRLEIEAVAADRGARPDLSYGLRIASYAPGADLYLAVARQWRDTLASAGVSATAGAFRLRVDATQPLDPERNDLSRARASLGVGFVRRSLTLTLEGHYNGTGVERVADYGAHLATSPELKRGEVYLLGRWYAGAAAVWKPSELFQLSVSAQGNVRDRSALLVGALAYQVSQGTELSIGAYRGAGTRLLLAPAPELRSEFGGLGGLYYLALASFF